MEEKDKRPLEQNKIIVEKQDGASVFVVERSF